MTSVPLDDSSAAEFGVAPKPEAPPAADLHLARTAVVLAAGRSERLREMTGGGSKALLRVGGLPLVERVVRTLLDAGIARVLVVIGHHAGPVAAVVTMMGSPRVRTILAEHWERGNGASLAAAETVLTSGSFALVTADHVFSEGALNTLLTSPDPAVLVDLSPSPSVWDEGTKVRIQDGSATAFGKHLDEPAVDCGAFVLPSEIFTCVRRAAAAGDCTLAGAVTRLAAERPLRTVALPKGAWWRDVDTIDDLRQARILLRTSLIRASDGPVSRRLNRPISTRLSMALAPLRPPPDLVSWLSFVLGLVATGLLASGVGIVGGILVLAASILDGTDGELARLQFRASPRGAMLDGILDRLADAAILAGLGLWALEVAAVSPASTLLLTVAATTGAMLSMATKDRASALGLGPAPERALSYLLGGRDGRLLLVGITAIAGQPAVGLAAVAGTSLVSSLLRLAFVRRLTRGGSR